MSLSRAARPGVALVLGALASSACPSWTHVEPYGQLPDVTACPLGRGGACEVAHCGEDGLVRLDP